MKNIFNQFLRSFLVILLVTSFVNPVLAKRHKYVQVVKVYDGDTIKIDSGDKVRLIGIDSPETRANKKLYKDIERTGYDQATMKAMGKKAFAFTQELLLGQKVYLEFDVRKTDQYGRLLAYVYLPDGTFVNQKIIQSGFAYPMTIPPNVKYAAKFQAAFQEAQAAKNGLWAAQMPKSQVINQMVEK